MKNLVKDLIYSLPLTKTEEQGQSHLPWTVKLLRNNISWLMFFVKWLWFWRPSTSRTSALPTSHTSPAHEMLVNELKGWIRGSGSVKNSAGLGSTVIQSISFDVTSHTSRSNWDETVWWNCGPFLDYPHGSSVKLKSRFQASAGGCGFLSLYLVRGEQEHSSGTWLSVAGQFGLQFYSSLLRDSLTKSLFWCLTLMQWCVIWWVGVLCHSCIRPLCRFGI